MRPMRSLSVASLLLAAPSVLAAAPAAPGYAQAEAYVEKDARPEHYSPLNLLDGRDTTAWCAEGEKPAHVIIGFKEPVTLDEVRVYTGDGTSRDAFKANGRVRKFTLTSVEASRSVTVQDKRGLQAVPLTQPLFGARFVLEVADRFPGTKEGAPVCITDLVLYSGGKPLNAPALATRFKYEARVAPLLGTWFGGHEGAPERFLSFFVDGTWRFSLEPLETPEPTTVVTGTYTVSGGRVTLDIPKKGRVPVAFERSQAEEGPKASASLSLKGALPEEWGSDFRSHP
ncbi:discoidin domain-containing protein [Corallococcus terminator]|uniref:Discoidin domain-containing protein n=2 Tax=Corallococcus terminator TaxID=2316733 RepID=A0A3A8IUI4_9BACT|nr:discoidin domain-containing protein [Corallococcus terminator]